jgi:hypothetical protein
MATTDPILDKLKEATLREEMAVPLYTSHISAALFWSGLPEKKQKRIVEILEILERESNGHIQTFKKITALYRASRKR